MPSRKKGYAKKTNYVKKTSERSEATKDHILRIVHSAGGRWLTANEIAKKAKTTWTTALIYLNDLFHEGYLQKGTTEGGLTCWKENE